MTDQTQEPSVPTAHLADSPAGAGGFVVRALTEADWPATKSVDAAAFGYAPDHDFLDTVSRPQYDLGRFTGVFDPLLDNMLVGIGGIQSRSLTFPGLGPAPAAAVTWVGVRPDQQRRGILRQVMKHQLHGLHQGDGEAVAILTASESGIYGRFGYGLATHRTAMALPAPTPLRPDIAVEPVLEHELAQALPKMKELYSRLQPVSVGFLDRPDAVWNQLYSEHPFVQKSRGPRRIALHRDGYITYRLEDSWTDRGPDSSLSVSELFATTPAARASLWRHVLNYPLVRRVTFRLAWVDEPLPEMVGNPRAISSDIGDHVWVRLVDLPRAVALRSYSCPVSVVVRVSDTFCPWNGGVWQLDLDEQGGRATRSDRPAEVVADVADLGAAFLGGTRIARLAFAGRVTGDPAAVARLDAAMGTPLRPCTPEGF